MPSADAPRSVSGRKAIERRGRLFAVLLLVASLLQMVDSAQGQPKAARIRITDSGLPEAPQPLESVREVAFSGDGRWLAIRGEPSDPATPRTILLWDRARERPHRTLTAGTDSLVGISFSPDSRSLAATSQDSPLGLRIWSLPAGEALPPMASGRGRVAFRSESGQIALLAGQGKNEVVRWHLPATGAEMQRFIVPSTYLHDFAPDAMMLAGTARLQDASLRVIDIMSGKELRKLAAGERQPTTIRFTPNGRTLMACYPDAGAIVWELATGERVTTWKSDSTPISAALSSDERLLAVGSANGEISLLDLASGAVIATLRGHSRPVTALAFDPEVRQLASGGLDRTVLIWNLKDELPADAGTAMIADAEHSQLWDALGAGSAAPAYQAIHRIRAAGPNAVAELLARLRRQLMPPERVRIEQLIAELDHPDSIVRQRATLELRSLRELARPTLQRLVREAPSAEVRYRARRILHWGDLTPRFVESDTRRMHRILHLLEQFPGEDALNAIDLIAREYPNDEVRHDAERTRKRLKPTAGS